MKVISSLRRGGGLTPPRRAAVPARSVAPAPAAPAAPVVAAAAAVAAAEALSPFVLWVVGDAGVPGFLESQAAIMALDGAAESVRSAVTTRDYYAHGTTKPAEVRGVPTLINYSLMPPTMLMGTNVARVFVASSPSV